MHLIDEILYAINRKCGKIKSIEILIKTYFISYEIRKNEEYLHHMIQNLYF
jgi:hypothetical protein